MKILNKIRNPEKYLVDITDKQKFVIGIQVSSNTLKEKFDVFETKQGNKVYSPQIVNGIYAKRNTLGEYIPDKTRPKEICYRALQWELRDWGGNWHEGVSYVPYQRYPRNFIESKNIKFTIKSLANDEKILIANYIFKKQELDRNNLDLIKFIVNLLIETVGNAEIFPLDSITEMPVRVIETVNWQILPKGERIYDFVKHGINHVSKSEKVMIQKRVQFLESYFPDTIYKGVDSYTGYLVFYYKNKGLYVFDSIMYGQATYVFDKDWEKVSKLTKKQIIDNNIAKARLIHNNSWKSEVAKLLK